jgi:predicted TIM-barrel fold metal-dependent hydrolase
MPGLIIRKAPIYTMKKACRLHPSEQTPGKNKQIWVIGKIKIKFMRKFFFVIILILPALTWTFGQEALLLKDFDPVSIYKIPETTVEKARFPVIDMHSHPYTTTEAEVKSWIKIMDELNIEKTIILTGKTGKAFDSIYNIYNKYPDRFEVWCGIDFTGYKEKGWSQRAVKELERCYTTGARGVGEITDKGEGILNSGPIKAYGMHFDNPGLIPVYEKCAELGMPLNIHVAEPYWMYLPIDQHNDGLMNAETWKIDTSKEGILHHRELINTLETIVKQNPRTTFIACHVANCSYDLSILGKLLETYDNVYADIAARYAELSPIPRHVEQFFEKHQDKLLYGTDMGFEPSMYKTTFRILETQDEHFYEKDLFSYHWPLYGLGLSDHVLEKLYHKNAQKILK